MTKAEKRARIKEIEKTLDLVVKHKLEIAEFEKAFSAKTEVRMNIKFTIETEAGSGIRELRVYPPDFMKTSVMLTLYKMEIDQEEEKLTKELEGLIS